MRLPRKLKKKINNLFGNGTYKGIVDGYLTIEKYDFTKGTGIISKYTDKPMINEFYNSNQYNPFINLPKIYRK